MKILLLTEKADLFFHFLVESLNGLNTPVAHASFPISSEEMQEFDPDIIFHNVESISKVNYRDSITISINELQDSNCFSLKNQESPNFIKPFIKLTKDELENHKYKSDVVYVGNPNLLPDCIIDLQKDPNVNFKIINSSPSPISSYCGSANFEDYKKFFKMAKCTLVNRVDSKLEFPSFKLLDIIYSGGNPVLHDGDDDKFIADVKGALDGKCFRDKFISRQEIISNHTNHDRMSEIFGKIGLNKISQMILNSKGI